MGRILIFKEEPPSDDSWIVGIIILLMLILAWGGFWPLMYDRYMSTEDEEEQKFILLLAGIVLGSCICTTIIYIISEKIRYGITKFSEAFWTICIFTTLATGIISLFVFSGDEEITGENVFQVFWVALFCSGAPSFVGTCIWVLCEKRR